MLLHRRQSSLIIFTLTEYTITWIFRKERELLFFFLIKLTAQKYGNIYNFYRINSSIDRFVDPSFYGEYKCPFVEVISIIELDICFYTEESKPASIVVNYIW